jgi:hypothetical protein
LAGGPAGGGPTAGVAIECAADLRLRLKLNH